MGKFSYYFLEMTNEEMLAHVVKAIRAIRREKEISQMELCMKANMSQGFLTDVETGKKEPSTMTLIRIAQALEVSPREFFPEAAQAQSVETKSEIKKEIIRLLSSL